jgi:hypothetical protein
MLEGCVKRVGEAAPAQKLGSFCQNDRGPLLAIVAYAALEIIHSSENGPSAELAEWKALT